MGLIQQTIITIAAVAAYTMTVALVIMGAQGGLPAAPRPGVDVVVPTPSLLATPIATPSASPSSTPTPTPSPVNITGAPLWQ